MCQRNAENKNVGSLPHKFWNKKPWDWTYKKQLFRANQILKDFSEAALVKAVHSPEFKSIFSLNHPKVLGIIRRYELLLEEQEHSKQEIEVKENPKQRKKTFGRRNTLNRLRNIENGKEEKDD
jgi:hypothetical protein